MSRSSAIKATKAISKLYESKITNKTDEQKKTNVERNKERYGRPEFAYKGHCPPEPIVKASVDGSAPIRMQRMTDTQIKAFSPMLHQRRRRFVRVQFASGFITCYLKVFVYLFLFLSSIIFAELLVRTGSGQSGRRKGGVPQDVSDLPSLSAQAQRAERERDRRLS